MTPKVSVIIPVFKVEDYIEKCVRSLFEQTLAELEFIFVDDKSPDQSLKIVKNLIAEYPQRASQIKIIKHERNKGVSQSRQDGLEASSGEYLIHCDPDDWMEPDALSLLYDKAKESNADIVISDYYMNEASQYRINNGPDDLSYKTVLCHIAGTLPKRLIGATWNKLIKREIAKKSCFNPGIPFCEDVLYLFGLLDYNPSVAYLEKPIYHYNFTRTESSIKTFKEETLSQDLKLIEKVRSSFNTGSFKNSGISEAFIADLIISRLFLYKFTDKKAQIKELRKNLDTFVFNKKQSKIDKTLAFYALKYNFTLFRFIFYRYKDIRNLLHRIKYRS